MGNPGDGAKTIPPVFTGIAPDTHSGCQQGQDPGDYTVRDFRA